MEEKLFIPILLGTNRKERRSEKVARLIERVASQRGDMEIVFFDAQDFVFPQQGYGPDIISLFPQWKEAIEKADGLLIVSPEYNHGYPGILKSILDTVSRDHAVHKASGIIGVSSGMIGGARMAHSILSVVRTLGFMNIWLDMYFPSIKEAFDEEGNPKDGSQIARIEKFLDEFVWQARTLRWGRENVDSPFHTKKRE